MGLLALLCPVAHSVAQILGIPIYLNAHPVCSNVQLRKYNFWLTIKSFSWRTQILPLRSYDLFLLLHTNVTKSCLAWGAVEVVCFSERSYFVLPDSNLLKAPEYPNLFILCPVNYSLKWILKYIEGNALFFFSILSVSKHNSNIKELQLSRVTQWTSRKRFYGMYKNLIFCLLYKACATHTSWVLEPFRLTYRSI